METIDRIISVLVSEDMATALDFLIGASGFASGGIHRMPDGNVVQAEVLAGNFRIWLLRGIAEHQVASPCSLVVRQSI